MIHNYLKTSLIIPISLFFLFSCATKQHNTGSGTNNKTTSKQVTEKYKALAVEKYQSGIKYLFNEDRTYVLCIKDKKGTAQFPQNNVKFFAYNLKEEKIDYEKIVGQGYVKWYDKDWVEMYFLPGIMRDDQTRDDYTTLYNVKTNKSINKRVFLNSEIK